MAERRTTTCNRDCPDTCRIVATVENGRVLRLQGDRTHPVTQGFLCERTNRFLHLQYGERRILQPLIRVQGELRPTTWETALAMIAERLTTIREESGPAAIFHYRSGGSLGMLVAEASDRFFEHFGPVTTKSGDICSGAGEHAQMLDFGTSDASGPDQIEHARQILLWGKNVYTSSPHTIPFIKRAQQNGARAMLIDPVHHRAAQLCDAVVQPRPGGDFALAMAVARVMFERGAIDPAAETYCRGLPAFEGLARSRSVAAWCEAADVSLGDAEEIATRLADGPAMILVGWGMGRRRNGGAIVRAIDALAAISGNIGRPGTGASFYVRRRRAFRSTVRGDRARTICEPLFGRGILEARDPPIRAVWITAGNPVAMLPDAATNAEALRTREFVVVVDPFMTDTTALADVVLPTTTLLEADDVLGAYGHAYLGVATPVVPPPPDVWSELAIFQALSDRVGLHGLLDGNARAWKERLLRPELEAAGIDLGRLEQESVRNPLAPTLVFEDRRFATGDERVHLLEELPEGAIPPSRDLAFPLTLMSLSTPQSQSSQWSSAAPEVVELRVHPDAAGDVREGDVARLVSRVGALRVRVTYDEHQRRDVALVPKGGHFGNGTSANAIIRAATTDIGEGGALYDEAVRLEAWADF